MKKINKQIKSKVVRVILNDENLGIFSLKDALELSVENNLDLVQVTQTNPPVCKIIDYGKYLYDLNKTAKAQKHKNHEVKFGVNIEDHDYLVKMNHLKTFIKNKDKVKVTIVFRGRQKAHVDIGKNLAYRIIEDIKQSLGNPASKLSFAGNSNISFTFE